MNRRNFLKAFALGAAGLYIPKRSYFFMPRMKEWTTLDLSYHKLRPLEIPSDKDGGWPILSLHDPHANLDITPEMIAELHSMLTGKQGEFIKQGSLDQFSIGYKLDDH